MTRTPGHDRLNGSLQEPPGVGHAQPLDDLIRRLTPADQRLIRELIYKLATTSGAAVTPPEAPDLSAYVAPWATHVLAQGRSPATVQLYRYYVQLALREYPRPTLPDLQDFLAARAAVGKRSTGNAVNALRSFYGFLVDREVVTANPASRLKAASYPQRERKIPTPNQVARLASSPIANMQDRAIVLVLAACGLRISELLTSQRADLHLDDPPAIRVIGKGDKQRTVPMAHEAARALEQHLRNNLPAECKWLFPGRRENRPMTAQAVELRFRELCDSAGIPRVTPHQLRHYFASVLLSRGVNLKVVSRLMGHASPTVTANVYWHLMDEGALLKAYQEGSPLRQVNDEMARLATDQLTLDFGTHDFGGKRGT